MEVNSSRFTIQDILHHSLELWQEKISKSAIEMTFDNEESPLEIEGIQSCFVQIFSHLVSNSYHAIKDEKNPWIFISIKRKFDQIEIKIKDSGQGIPREIESHIFTPFFTSKKTSNSSGLGLPLVKSIIRSMNGDIYVDKSEPNTCFTINLPYQPS